MTSARSRAIAWRCLRIYAHAAANAATLAEDYPSSRNEEALNHAQRELRDAARTFAKVWPKEHA